MAKHTIRVRKTKPNQTIEKTGQQSTAKEFLLFLSIPVAIIIIVAAIVQGPSLFARPSYDFIYSVCTDYVCDGSYAINSKNHVTYTSDTGTGGTDGITKPTLYYYSEKEHSSQQITLKQASGYALDTANVSPDGYVLWQDTGSDSGLFGDGGTYNWYLKNGSKRKQLNLAGDSYNDDPQLMGWVQ